MRPIRTYFLLLAALAVLAGCKHKKRPSLSGEEPVAINDFMDFFPEVKLPFQFADTDLEQKDPDSLRISYKVFSQFVPDSSISRICGKGVRPQFFPMGKVSASKEELYFFVKAVSGERSTALLACFDKKKDFLAAMPVLQPDQNAATVQVSGIDKNLSVYKIVRRKNADGTVSEGKDVYILNASAKNFMLILTDQLEDHPTELINPIDTLARKNKLSADYTAGKMNLVSIRDGRKPNRILFFIHFEKNNHECIGDLKGEAVLRSPTLAEFHSNTDPCVLQLSFTPSTVTIKEMEGCGSHRGLHCVFEGTFIRKKEMAKKKKH
ncbi:MAG TPA: hypothetical protein VHD35_12980 [Chitinophagaceae bacterium]|nr:hypothetical protein [Chitinophagaceae bacterium]